MVKVLILVLGLCLSQVWAAAVPSTGDNSLAEFLIRARSFGASPGRFDYCFDYATKELTEANDYYDWTYKKCIGIADRSLQAADNATAKDREEMFRRVDNDCWFVMQCQPSNFTVVEELNCISTRSKGSSSTLNDVAANAALTKDQLERSYQSIISDRDICTLKAHQEFNRQTDSIYLQWERCLQGAYWTTKEPLTTPDAPSPTTEDYETTWDDYETTPF